MFQNRIDDDEEKSFSDAYRSEILNPNSNKEEGIPLKKLMFILLLVVLVSTLSILGYKYFNTPTSDTTTPHGLPVSIKQTENHNEEVVELTKEGLPQTEVMMLDNVADLDILESAEPLKEEPTPTAMNSDINDIATQMKLEIAKELDKNNENSLPKETSHLSPVTPSAQKGEKIYMKQLAELSKEIDEGKK